eukprot:1183464-Prorocentrum_minimum.AAC.3
MVGIRTFIGRCVALKLPSSSNSSTSPTSSDSASAKVLDCKATNRAMTKRGKAIIRKALMIVTTQSTRCPAIIRSP